jgi:CheY-like chemotaxis protein
MCRRVLIVDDNSDFRAAARQLLERNGGFVIVAEAGSGNGALQEAETHCPDLALVDLQLPDFDGFEVAEKLCRLNPAPRVILTSSLDGSDFGALIIGSPAVGFIPKGDLSAVAIEALLAPIA